mmetsp:Transcript_6996/g.19799  ORF Transcript_6996/g.19799 Transcript_6996/m.19799 type:complete len:249 (+) Transcript_6996:128-874(+)
MLHLRRATPASRCRGEAPVRRRVACAPGPQPREGGQSAQPGDRRDPEDPSTARASGRQALQADPGRRSLRSARCRPWPGAGPLSRACPCPRRPSMAVPDRAHPGASSDSPQGPPRGESCPPPQALHQSSHTGPREAARGASSSGSGSGDPLSQHKPGRRCRSATSSRPVVGVPRGVRHPLQRSKTAPAIWPGATRSYLPRHLEPGNQRATSKARRTTRSPHSQAVPPAWTAMIHPGQGGGLHRSPVVQ